MHVHVIQNQYWEIEADLTLCLADSDWLRECMGSRCCSVGGWVDTLQSELESLEVRLQFLKLFKNLTLLAYFVCLDAFLCEIRLIPLYFCLKTG